MAILEWPCLTYCGMPPPGESEYMQLNAITATYHRPKSFPLKTRARTVVWHRILSSSRCQRDGTLEFGSESVA